MYGSASGGLHKVEKIEPSFHVKLEDMGNTMSHTTPTGSGAPSMHASDVTLMGGSSLRSTEVGNGAPSPYNAVLDYSATTSHHQQQQHMSLTSGYGDVSAYADYHQHSSPSSGTTTSSDGFDTNGESYFSRLPSVQYFLLELETFKVSVCLQVTFHSLSCSAPVCRSRRN